MKLPDALLGRQTRSHHDLDLMVRTEDLPALDLWVRRHRFEPDALTGVGQIGGVHVPCMSKAAQAAMHHGYDLPQNHLQDLALLNDHVP